MPTQKQLMRFALLAAAAAGVGRHYVRRQRRMEFRGATVVITGGSRGLGLELARLWCAEGARVAICSRTKDDVEAAVSELRQITNNVFGETCDISQPPEVESFLSRVRRQFSTIDVLVNDAGIIQVGPQELTSEDDFRQSLETHFWGPLRMIEGVLPEMKRRGSGRIVNISSIGGKISVPHLLLYCTGKFALAGYSSGLRHALRKYGILVTTVYPGLMRTGSPRHALFKGQHRAEYAWFSIGDSIPGVTIGSLRAAQQIVEACRYGQAELIASLPAKLAVRVNALFPEITAGALNWINRVLPRATSQSSATYSGAESESFWSPSPLTTLNERAAVRNREVH